MILPIDDRYRIRSDSLAWMIERPRKEKGQMVWRPCKWYPTAETCIRALGELMCRQLDTETLTEGLAGIDRVSRKLSRALAPHFDIKEEAG